MPGNTLTRDQILNRAFDMMDSPRLDERVRGGNNGPTAVITDPSMATQWIQDGLNLLYNLLPLQAQIAKFALTLTVGQDTYAIPSTYIQDVRDGVIIDNYDSSGNINGIRARVYRRGLSHLLGWQTGGPSQNIPVVYTVFNNNIIFRPVPNAGNSPASTYTANLYYYSLPASMVGTTIPSLPDPLYLIEYVINRGKEWLRELPLGSADQNLRQSLAKIINAGLWQEGEEDQIAIDRQSFPGTPATGQDPNAWMGTPAITTR